MIQCFGIFVVVLPPQCLQSVLYFSCYHFQSASDPVPSTAFVTQGTRLNTYFTGPVTPARKP